MAAYLQSADYAAYGIPGATDAQVNQATRLIDGKLGRPGGLLWSPDAHGQPAWMTNQTATRNYTLSAPVVPGISTIEIDDANFGHGDVGAAVVIDRAGTPETCVITAAGGNTITLIAQFNHAAGVTLEYGLTIAEDVDVTRGGMIPTTARPLVSLLSVTGNYRQGRGRHRLRGDWIDEILSIGIDGDTWVPFPLDQCDVDAVTGVCWLLPGTVRGGFSRVRVNYIAGWDYPNLPYPIKQATANLVATMMTSEIPANIKLMKAGDATLVNFNSSLFDSDTENLLQPYRNLRI